jgi:hypothetical protein
MRDHAAALAPLAGGAEAGEVEAFLRSALGPRGGGGLQALAESAPPAGKVFGAPARRHCWCSAQGGIRQMLAGNETG